MLNGRKAIQVHFSICVKHQKQMDLARNRTLTKTTKVFPRMHGDDSDSDSGDDDEGESHEEDEETKSTFLFVHQDHRQQKILQTFGEMVLLDATYKTSKYSLPLFLVVVRTNIGYVPVAEFIVETETQLSIAEALSMIKSWMIESGHDWMPKHFMVDYSDVEYQAIHSVFPDAKIYLCIFHAKQAWLRWSRQGRFHNDTIYTMTQNIFIDVNLS